MKKIIFVADMFAEQYPGGAELTTKAIMQGCIYANSLKKVNCKSLTIAALEKYHDHHFIVCNFTSLSEKVKIYMCKNVDYSIIEYDYKFCQYRSMNKHKAITGNECDCVEQMSGKINSAFYGYAKKV